MEGRKHLIIEFICKVTRKKQIQLDEDIFEGGIVNSLFAMQLVLFLEKRFGIRISGKDLKQVNFRTVNAIDEFIDSKLEEN